MDENSWSKAAHEHMQPGDINIRQMQYLPLKGAGVIGLVKHN